MNSHYYRYEEDGIMDWYEKSPHKKVFDLLRKDGYHTDVIGSSEIVSSALKQHDQIVVDAVLYIKKNKLFDKI